jgi:hypothetical protein
MAAVMQWMRLYVAKPLVCVMQVWMLLADVGCRAGVFAL